ncbi:MAG: RNA-binding S4 domain-containing protein [Pyrinomonadaceae bacterium]
MRLDLFLKASRLIVRRSLAQKFCDAGMVKVNDQTAKSSKTISDGDEIEIRRGDRLIRVRVLEVPEKKQVSKQEAPRLYEIISEETVEDDLFD